jgi:hypothetical protein
MNAALVKIDVAAAHLGWSAAKLFELVDGGTLLEKGFAWVFNLANDVNGERRDLRFWWPEVEARAKARAGQPSNAGKLNHYEIDWVIARILPEKRVNFHAGELDQLFQIRPRTRIDLHAELSGSLDGGRNFYPRPALVAFLQRRWLGAVSSRTAGSTESRPTTGGPCGTHFHPAGTEGREKLSLTPATKPLESRIPKKAVVRTTGQGNVTAGAW